MPGRHEDDEMRREQNTRAEEKPATDGGRAEPQKNTGPATDVAGPVL
jgi:hypothetical protein